MQQQNQGDLVGLWRFMRCVTRFMECSGGKGGKGGYVHVVFIECKGW